MLFHIYLHHLPLQLLAVVFPTSDLLSIEIDKIDNQTHSSKMKNNLMLEVEVEAVNKTNATEVIISRLLKKPSKITNLALNKLKRPGNIQKRLIAN
jgi:hypothetical protein